jgi:hypothetical protein
LAVESSGRVGREERFRVAPEVLVGCGRAPDHPPARGCHFAEAPKKVFRDPPGSSIADPTCVEKIGAIASHVGRHATIMSDEGWLTGDPSHPTL